MTPVYWKGYLKLSLVTCSVAMGPATTRSERIGFHNLNSSTGHRLRVQRVDEKTHRPVDEEDIVKGYEIRSGDLVMLSDEELKNVALESTHTIDVAAFVSREEVDERYLNQPYFLAPDDDVAQEPFAVIRDAMQATGQVGLGQVVLDDREWTVMLKPRNLGILVWRLHYAYEGRDATQIFERIKLPEPGPAAVKTMRRIIDEKRGRFEPKLFTDPLQEAYRRIIEAKRHHRAPPKIKVGPGAPEGGKVISFMDALKRSLAAEPKRAGDGRRAQAHGRRPSTRG